MASPVVVDAMGGDFAPRDIVKGAVLAAEDGLAVRLVGREQEIRPWLRGAHEHLEIVHADDVVGMGESAVAAVRRSDRSSLRVAMREVADGRAAGLVSCGHTGAVLVAALFDLGALPGVERPAIATVLPRSDGGRLVMLDAGANVDVRPELLATFAVLGVAYAEALGISRPRVGVLSNGREPSKGHAGVRAVLPLLERPDLRTVGPIEPTDALEGGCDVLVTDGFTGNVLLKAAEAAVNTMTHLLRQEIERSPVSRAGAFLMRGALRRFRERVAWDAYGGAMLLGTKGTVVVGHGRATPQAVRRAIGLAYQAAAGNLVERVAAGMAGH